MPELRRLALNDIDEPPLPVRVAMDEHALADLADSMAKIGLLQPIIVKPVDGRFEIECGHRRFLAAASLGWKEIPALIFEPAELASGAAMLAENICREDITAAEEALLFAQAQERFTLDEAGLVAMFRRSPDYIGDRLRLLREDPEVFRALNRRVITFSVARELNKVSDEQMRRYYLDAAIRGGANTRTVAGWRQQWLASQSPATNPGVGAEPATELRAEPTTSLACFLCGGSLDPWNLDSVYIHKWEREQIIKMLKQAAEV
jgi:ParB family chromosome partitioning protein